MPGYVEGEFRRYLECGILAHDFARARCGDCGHDFLIAFSCTARGMSILQRAAHGRDRCASGRPGLPAAAGAPVGDIRAEAAALFSAARPRVNSAVLHILLRVIEAQLRQRSGCMRGRLEAVSFVQRFGAALNAHVHVHCCAIDGVLAAGEHGQVYLAEAGVVTL